MIQHKRVRIVFVMFSTVLTVVVMRAGWLQLIPNERLEAYAKRQYATVLNVAARRGDIIDRHGNELATSIGSWSLFADPARISDPYTVASRLAEAVYQPRTKRERLRFAKTLVPKLRGRNRRFVWVARQLDRRVRDRVEQLDIRGLGFIEEPKRIYPNGKLAAHLLGFVGHESRGLEGLEYKLDAALQGTRKTLSVARDARGRPLVASGQLLSSFATGSQVQLTIDRDLQFVVEQELAAAVAEHEAESGMAVVLDAKTSELLAVATVPQFDPSRAAQSPQSHRRSRAVVDMFEPGSTMKTFVVAEAIHQGRIEPNTKVFAENGVMQVGSRKIREADSKHKFGWITVTEVLAQSSNIGSYKIAQLLGDEQLRNAYLRFGFGDRTGVDLPGEASGLIAPLPWHDHLLANASFGHGIAASVLQVANAYAAIANGGLLKRPFVVKRIYDPETGAEQIGQEQTIRRVISEEAARKMRLILSAATQETATGAKARVQGFPVGGKTGTAQRVLENGRGYESGAYISSFSGFLPAQDPQFVISVSIDRPRKQYYGSAVAAPVFSKIANFAVRRAGLNPVVLNASNVLSPDRFSGAQLKPDVAAPVSSLSGETELGGLTLREALEEVQRSHGSWSSALVGEDHRKKGRIKLHVNEEKNGQKVRLYFEDTRSL